MKNIKTDFNRDHYYFQRDSKLKREDFEDYSNVEQGDVDNIAMVLLCLVFLFVIVGGVYGLD